MRRRSFLGLLAAGTVAGRASLAQEIVPRPPRRVLLSVAGINVRTGAETLGALLAALMAATVPVSLIVEPGDGEGEGAERITPETEIARLLVRYLESFPGLVELVAWRGDLGAMPPYQAARAAQKARQDLIGALYSAPLPGHVALPLLTLACDAPLDSNAASACLASGFRNLLALPETVATEAARLDRQGVLSLLGGERVALPQVAAALARGGLDEQRHLILSADEISRTDVDSLFAAAQKIGRILKDGALDQSMLSVLANDVQMRSEVAFRRRVAVHLLEPASQDPAAMADLAALRDALTAEGIGFSQGPASTKADPAALSYWVPLGLPQGSGGDPDMAFGVFAGQGLVPVQAGAVATGDMRFGAVVRPVLDPVRVGFTAEAELNIPVLAFVGGPGQETVPGPLLPPRSDGVVLVSAAALRDPALRSAFVAGLRQVVAQADVRLMPIEEYCAETLPKDPLLPPLLLARTRAMKPVASAAVPDDAERAALMADAQSAWAYFAQNTNNATGLCPATTVMAQKPQASHLSVSMWEGGSHLNALIAAVDLGLIDEDGFRARCKQLLRSIERASRKRLVLPPETIHAITGKGTTRFNSYDTGRLLIAMNRLRHHRFAPEGLEDLVASWDFAQVVIDRRMHSYRDRQMIDDFASNYSDYAASGMRLWGFDVASPFDGFSGLTSADQEAELLAATVSFGLLAAEPCFLYLLEMPASPTAAFLGDCLDAIQTRLAEESGSPAAPSESPIDRPPWFTYQGFDLRRLSDPWTVDYLPQKDDNITQAEVDLLRATSTKAAYMWHALRPNAHSLRLIQILRGKARQTFGFDSAMFLESGATTTGYADLNTNAVILQSIAHILGPR